MSVEGVPMEDLHQELERIVPGSAEEQKILQTARQRREHKTDEFRAIRNAGMSEAAKDGVVRGHEAQHAAQIAIEKVTGEQEIPVEVIKHPEQMH